MKFLRMALIEFIEPPEDIKNCVIRADSGLQVTLSRMPGDGKPDQQLFLAMAIAERAGSVDARSGSLTIDTQTRLDCESLIEVAANSIVVSFTCRKRVYSHLMCYGLQSEGADDDAQLAALVDFPKGMIVYPIASLLGTAPGSYMEKLMDRAEGAAIMAECINNTTNLGRYRECIRLFELAFNRGYHAIVQPLAKFLKGAPHGYSKREVMDWVSYRNPSVHADKKESDRLTFERDVVRFMNRMQQAALEVLFNKDRWHHSSEGRRAIWTPLMAILPSGVQATETGRPVSVKLDFLDCFSVWQIYLGGGVILPSGYWFPNTPPVLPVQA